MAELNETPSGNRIRIAFFGLRNAGKSTLVNEFAGQCVAIVSPVAGTTTDPVSKAMEIAPLGPCTLTDTAGLDDVGDLGEMRVRKTLEVLAVSDIAVWVNEYPRGAEPRPQSPHKAEFLAECARRNVVALEHFRGESASALKARIAEVKLADEPRPLLEGVVDAGERVVLVCPMDESAPKGRLILPQVQVVRECLDAGAVCTVCQPDALAECLAATPPPSLVVTDSQAFAQVSKTMREHPGAKLTSFSVLFARQKGDLAAYAAGLRAIASLRDGDTVLIAEGCTHHRQCNDIGTVKLPRALQALSGRKLEFVFASGRDFMADGGADGVRPALAVLCGGCMLTRREVLRRIRIAEAASIPVTNYGLVLGTAAGLRMIPGTVFADYDNAK